MQKKISPNPAFWLLSLSSAPNCTEAEAFPSPPVLYWCIGPVSQQECLTKWNGTIWLSWRKCAEMPVEAHLNRHLLLSRLWKLSRFSPQRCLCEKSCRFLRRGDVYLLPPALNCVPAVLGAVILHQHSADYFHLVSLVRKWFWHALTPCLLGINMRAMEKLQTVNK